MWMCSRTALGLLSAVTLLCSQRDGDSGPTVPAVRSAGPVSPIRLPLPQGASVNFVAFAPNADRLLYNTVETPFDGSSPPKRRLVLFDLGRRKVRREIPLPADQAHAPSAARFSPDRKYLAVAYWEGAVALWDIAAAKELHAFEKYTFRGQCFTFSPDGKLLAGPDMTAGHIKIWDTVTGTVRQQVNVGDLKWVTALAFESDGKTILAEHQRVLESQEKLPRGRTYQRVVHRWDIESGKDLGRFRGAFQYKELSGSIPDDYLLSMLGAEPEGFRVKQLPDGTNMLSPHYRYVSPLSLSKVRGDTIGVKNLLSDVEAPLLRPLRGSLLQSAALARNGKAVAAVGQAAVGRADGVVLLWDLSASGGGIRVPGTTRYSPKELEQLWEWLASRDGTAAHRAMCLLASSPAQAVALIRAKVQPVPNAEATMARLLENLDSADFKKRERATRELARLGALTKPALRKALTMAPSQEKRRRTEELLGKLESLPIPPAEVRALRAIDVLEHINSESARGALKALAGGTPSALVTRTSAQSLRQMEPGKGTRFK